MIADLKPYSEYKESGQEWLGDVPSHWEVRRTKYLLREMDSRSMTGREQLLRVSQYTGVTQRKSADGSDAPDTRAASLKGYKIVHKNDLVINIMLAWNGSMGVSRFDGIVSPAYCVYRLNPEVMPWYFHELLRLPAYKGRIKSASTGVVESRLRLYSDDLGCIEALLPPPAEQAAIVRFLDHWNGRLEKAIRSKRRVIALLQEQKQAIIHRAVTRGLDPNVKLKDSGIPWLGDIPAHWDIVRLKLLVQVKDGTHDTPSYVPPGSGTYPLVTSKHIADGVIHIRAANHIGAVDYSEIRKRSDVTKGDVIMPMIGTIGNPVIVQTTDPFAIKNLALFKTSISKLIGADFLVYLLDSRVVKFQFDDLSRGGVQGFVSLGILRNLSVPRFSIEEQKEIVDWLNKELTKPNEAINRYENEITLLREYRTRLTADVVTGKLDVRAAAAQLPEEAEEEPLPDPEIPEDETETEDETEDFAE